ncbi:hypothetical protein ACN4EE_06685 [Geminocystis sp. CENA526]|uniref:hypothetical protein n=1 Tax=Geminocystis sp. CENA526 TaxID=1355871 RepID=UPI003D6E8A74
MFKLKFIIILLFLPSGFGLLWHSFSINNLSEQLISFAFFVFCLEQAKMAFIDVKPCIFRLDNVQNSNLNLSYFFIVVIITIVIELFGFYFALFNVGWGAIFVLISQIWFNCFAQVKINEIDNQPIQYYFSDKIIVLGADFLCLLLMGLWIMNIYPLTIAFVMLFLTVSFIGVKYYFRLTQCANHILNS